MVAATLTPVPGGGETISPTPYSAEPWVEVLEPGLHDGDTYTSADLSDMVRNFALVKRRFDPAIKIGHDERQPLLGGLTAPPGNSGIPAVGWVDDVKVEERKGRDGKSRPVLLARPADVHPHVAQLVRERAYRRASAEVYSRGLPAGVLSREEVLAELKSRGKSADSAISSALADAKKERARQQADRDRQLAAGVSEDLARVVESEETLAEAYLRKQLGKVLRGLAILGATPPVVKSLADLPWKTFSERRWAARSGVRCYAEGKGNMDRAEVEAHLKAAGWSDAMLASLAKLPDEDAMSLGMAVLAQLAGTADAAVGAVDATGAVSADTAVADDTGATPSREEMVADLVAMGEDQATVEALDDAALADLWKQKKGAAMSERTQRRPAATVALELAAFERRLKLAQQQQAALLAIQGRRYAQERQREDARLCERWRDEWYDLPREFDENPAVPNFRSRLAVADDTTVRKYGEKSMTERQALIAGMEARGKDYARRNFSEKVKDQHDAEGFADVDKQVDAYISRRYPKNRKTG